MKKRNRIHILQLLFLPSLLLLLVPACMKDELLWINRIHREPVTGRGLFIVNEGNFMYGNASLSYYDPETGEVINELFFDTNGTPLGDVAQSMMIRDSLGYIVVNNSGKVQVINIRTFEYVGKITGLTSPRYIHFINNHKAYVTDLYARSVSIVDPEKFEVTGTIHTGHGLNNAFQHPTEQMVQVDRFIYTNCWSFDNKVLVIDSETDRVVDSIEVLKQPNSLVVDRYHSLWILCDGGLEGSPDGPDSPGLMRVEAGSPEAQIVFHFSQGERPSELTINGTGDTLYYINRHVWRYAVDSDSPPDLFIPSPYGRESSGGFYGIGVDPVTSEIYVADAIDFVQPGVIYRYAPDGSPVDTFKTGIAPGSFCFVPNP
jgi:YVTN family beta-propeller protein